MYSLVHTCALLLLVLAIIPTQCLSNYDAECLKAKARTLENVRKTGPPAAAQLVTTTVLKLGQHVAHSVNEQDKTTGWGRTGANKDPNCYTKSKPWQLQKWQQKQSSSHAAGDTRITDQALCTHVPAPSTREDAAQPVQHWQSRFSKREAVMHGMRSSTSVAASCSKRCLLMNWWQVGSSYTGTPTDYSSKADKGVADSAAAAIPASCMRNRNRFPQPLWLRVQLALDDCCNNTTPLDNLTALQDQAVSAISRQLKILRLDYFGQLATNRVECYVDTAASSIGDVWLDAFIWLTSSHCEVINQMWLQLVSSSPSMLFSKDTQLAGAVINITSETRDPGRFTKLAIQNSGNCVSALVVNGAVKGYDGNSTNDSSDADMLEGDDYSAVDGIYLMAPFAQGPNFTGLMVMGITTISLFIVLALMIIMRKWAERRAERAQEAEVAAAVQAATEQAEAAVAGARAMAAAQQRGAESAVSSSMHSSRSSSGHLPI